MPVSISVDSTGVCRPSNDPIFVDAGHNVQWYASDKPYQITFSPKLDRHPGSPNTPPTDITPPPLSMPAQGTATWTALPNPPDCGDPTPHTPKTGCYFKYNIYDLTKTPPTLCNDPGIHVIPQ